MNDTQILCVYKVRRVSVPVFHISCVPESLACHTVCVCVCACACVHMCEGEWMHEIGLWFKGRARGSIKAYL